MKQGIFFISFCFIFHLATDISYAGAMLYRIQQMKAMKQQQAQAEYENAQGQQQSAQPPAQPTYQQTVDQRNQSIAQAILDANNQSVSTGSLPLPANTGTTSQAQAGSAQIQSQIQSGSPPIQIGSSQVADVVDLSEVWKKLDTKSTVWQLLIDDQAKVLTVSEYIDRFRKEGVQINQPPAHYVQMIDQLATDNPQMLQMPFGDLIKTLAIIEYDFDNGMDRDVLARKVLGDAGYEQNKKRFQQ